MWICGVRRMLQERESLKQTGAHVNIGDNLVALLAPAVARSVATPG